MIKIITISGKTYLGNITTTYPIKKKEKKKLKVSESMECDGTIDRGAISSYLRRENLGSLSEFTIHAKNLEYTIQELSAPAKLDYKIAKMTMDRAKLVAVPKVENKIFDELLGK